MPPRPPLVEIDCHLVDPRAPAEVDFYGGCNRSKFRASHARATVRASHRVAHQGFALRANQSSTATSKLLGQKVLALRAKF